MTIGNLSLEYLIGEKTPSLIIDSKQRKESRPPRGAKLKRFGVVDGT